MKLPRSSIDTIVTWRLGFVATVSSRGSPNLSPKGTFIVVDEETIAFGEMRSPNTIENIRTNSEVEINFIDILTRRGTRIRGKATIVERGQEKFTSLLPQFQEIWGEELCTMFNAIVLVPVDTVKPLQSPIYEIGGDEQELKTMWKNKIGEM